jgi:hypothetical protein
MFYKPADMQGDYISYLVRLFLVDVAKQLHHLCVGEHHSESNFGCVERGGGTESKHRVP